MEYMFVYGTLKTGQVRENNWPIKPQSIQLAWTLGQLYDVGPYPALVQGNDLIAGQIWALRNEDISETFKVLDAIEGTNQPGQENDSNRESIPIELLTGECVQASLYYFAKLDLLPQFEYIEPHLEQGGKQFSIWPRNQEW